jgi:hypothetical protein
MEKKFADQSKHSEEKASGGQNRHQAPFPMFLIMTEGRMSPCGILREAGGARHPETGKQGGCVSLGGHHFSSYRGA